MCDHVTVLGVRYSIGPLFSLVPLVVRRVVVKMRGSSAEGTANREITDLSLLYVPWAAGLAILLLTHTHTLAK